MTSQFTDLTSTSNFFDVSLLLLSRVVTGPSFMSKSSVVLELWQFSFIRDWPKIRKSEIPPSEFCPIVRDWDELWILNLARMSLIECYWMLQNSRVTAFTVFELLRKNEPGGRVKLPPPPHTDYLRSMFHWYVQGKIQAVWETGIPNNTFQVLFFQLYLNKKYVNSIQDGHFRGCSQMGG